MTPQLAMKVLVQFDKVVAEALAEKVRARLSFKVPCATSVFVPVLPQSTRSRAGK